MVEAVVGLAGAFMRPRPAALFRQWVGYPRFLVHPVAVDVAVFVQLGTPRGRLVKIGDLREVERELIDRTTSIGAWAGGGVPAHHALGVDQAALDLGVRPAAFDRAGSTLATVDHGDKWRGDAFTQLLVVAGGFVCAPMPGDDVVQGGSHNQASAGGVGAVEEDLVVDSAFMPDRRIGDIN